MCNCIGLCRDFSEMEGVSKSIKPSIHHQSCEDYMLIEYAEFRLEGGSAIILEKMEIDGFIESEKESGYIDGDDYTVAPIFLTQDQYDNLNEFDGF